MEKLRKGYKQTEIGIIPEDWEVKRLGKILTINYGKSQAEISNNDGYYPIIGTGGIVGYTNQFLYNNPSIIIGRKGSIDNPQYIDIPFWCIDTAFYTIIKEKCNLKYLYYNFCCIDWRSYNEASGVPSLNSSTIKSIHISVPTLAEQTAIATTLSDIDSLIEALDKKIAKKRAIKEGAMQELLTGKKRLAGFTGEWVEKKLGEIAEIVMGQSPMSQHYNDKKEGLPLIQGNADIENRKTVNKNYTSQITKKCNEGDVLLSVRAPVGAVAKAQFKACIGRGICAIKTDNDFLYHYLIYIENDWDKYSKGSTFDSINSNELKDIPIYLPIDKSEQIAISQILSDMDNEIELLEKERAKYTALKQGAMQKLLTGQIRLLNATVQPQKLAEFRTIPVAAHVVGGHIVKKLYGSKGWGRTKLQKSLHLVGYCCQLDLGDEYLRNVAGPDDQLLMNHIDSKFRQYRHVRIEIKIDKRGGKHYNYIPTSLIAEVEQAFERYPAETQNTINDLLHKITKMDLARAEIVSTLYAVWNNRIIKGQPINDDLLLSDFYDWSEHKSDFSRDLVLRGLNYMQQEGIIPVGWGKYIDKK